jgi:hypothetical protein
MWRSSGTWNRQKITSRILRFKVVTTASVKMTGFWDMSPCSLALITGTASISETSVYFNETTRRHISEACHLQISLDLIHRKFASIPYRILSTCILYKAIIKYTKLFTCFTWVWNVVRQPKVVVTNRRAAAHWNAVNTFQVCRRNANIPIFPRYCLQNVFLIYSAFSILFILLLGRSWNPGKKIRCIFKSCLHMSLLITFSTCMLT